MQVFTDLFSSKKVIVMVAAFLSGLAARKGLDIDAASLATVMSGVVAYILGQSYIDANQPPAPPAE